MIDIIYLAYNRLEFTKESMKAMLANTDWAQVKRIIICDDGSKDGTREYLARCKYPVDVEFVHSRSIGPVAITNHYLRNSATDMFAKIDNDTMLPPYWLTECLNVMEEHRELGLLGIEAFNEVVPGRTDRSYGSARYIGGIGLMRKNCFRTLPKPNGRFGFTQWQRMAPVVKGWINPSLPVFLLDKLPVQPWKNLSEGYIRKGWQRAWPLYGADQSALWDWWMSEDRGN